MNDFFALQRIRDGQTGKCGVSAQAVVVLEQENVFVFVNILCLQALDIHALAQNWSMDHALLNTVPVSYSLFPLVKMYLSLSKIG